ncbi:50S ribosome-binding GTPase [Helicobacter pylori]|uniref:GTPase n=1 Tax=Helicobacter pylori TaxID=210 RepID=UPI001FD24F38|nr:GTPase [Helicobacter pylori]UOS17187.1 50S ribosome-binding GTPase [Helicobacter pylori]
MKNIYLDVKANIENLQNIFKNTDDKDEKLKRFNQEALEVFQKLEFESLKELESLKNNEEWEKFTIAFYGETGAGKSTLIECLRLFFKEPGKMDQQERFKRLYANMKNSNYVKNYESNEHADLEKLQDGAIIGDGRSDSTLETKSYTLKHNNQSFVLLDVPGIEGDEKKLNSKFLTLQEKPMLFFMLQKHPLLRKKEKREKRELLKRSKSNSIRKQRYIPYSISRSIAQEP